MYVKLYPVAENSNKKILFFASVAGWSSSVARWAHNPEVVGSNPAPATSLEPPVRESELGVPCVLVHILRSLRTHGSAYCSYRWAPCLKHTLLTPASAHMNAGKQPE